MLSNFEFDVELQLRALRKRPDSAQSIGERFVVGGVRPCETFGATFPVMRSQ
jgi:hypothetical protein